MLSAVEEAFLRAIVGVAIRDCRSRSSLDERCCRRLTLGLDCFQYWCAAAGLGRDARTMPVATARSSPRYRLSLDALRALTKRTSTAGELSGSQRSFTRFMLNRDARVLEADT